MPLSLQSMGSWYWRTIIRITKTLNTKSIPNISSRNRSFWSINLQGHWGTSTCTNNFATVPVCLVLFSVALAELALSISVHSLILSPPPIFFSASSSTTFSVPWRIVFAMPEDLEMWPNTSVSVSWPRSGAHHILQWLLWYFCEPPHRLYGACTRCSIAFGSILSQTPASFSLILQSRSKIQRQQKYGMTRKSKSFSF